MIANLAARGSAEQQQLLMEAFAGNLCDDDSLRSGWALVLPMYFHQYDAKLGVEIVKQMEFSVAAFNYFTPLILSMNMLTQLGTIDTQTLIIAGRHDWISLVKCSTSQSLTDGELITLACQHNYRRCLFNDSEVDVKF